MPSQRPALRLPSRFPGPLFGSLFGSLSGPLSGSLSAGLALLMLVASAWGVSAKPAAAPQAAPDADLAVFSDRLSALAERCEGATVGIVVPGGSMGSGVLIDEAGLILTAAHVLPKDGEPVVIVLSDGRQLKGESLGRNDRVDSAMARVTQPDAGPLPHADIAEPGTVWEGDWCIAFGHGGGVQTDRPAPMRLGRVLHVSSDTSATRWITTDCTVISGDSGGPLFNLDGQVIGIHSNIGMSVLVNRHVPISAYHAQWEQLSEAGTIDTPPPPAEPVLPGLEALPDAIERGLARRLNDGDDTLREQLEAMRDEQGRINLSPEKAAELFGRDDMLDELRVWKDKLAERERLGDKIKDADAGGAPSDDQESDVSRQSRRTRMLIIEKKRERMLDDIAQDLRRTHGKIAPHVLSRFEPAASAAGPCTAQILSRGEVVALGTVVRGDGYLVTKASELVGPPRVRLGGSEYRAQVVNGNGPNDMVLLKIDAQGLSPVRWADATPAVGSLLVSPSAQGTPLAMSVVGVGARPITPSVNNLRIAPPPRPYLGISKLEDHREKPDNQDNQDKQDDPAGTPIQGVKVGEVVQDTPAHAAGLEPGDIITAIDGQPIHRIKALIDIINKARVGQTLTLSIHRGDQTLQRAVELAARPGTPEQQPNQQDKRDDTRSAAQVFSARGGALSNRRTDFPAALTHDAVIWANDIGGPVVNLDGEAVGLNIARYGRTATYAIPAEHAKQLIQQMMRGR